MCHPILVNQAHTSLLPVDEQGVASSSEAQRDAEDGLVGIFTEIRGQLAHKLRSFLGNDADVEDALQVAFLNCWRARAAVRQIGNVRSWVWRVSLNAGRDLRKYLRRRHTEPLPLVHANPVCRWASPADTLLEQEQNERLQAALVHLRPAEREVFLLRQQENLSFKEIAERRGCPIGTAKPLMHSALRKLKNHFNPESPARQSCGTGN